MVVSILVTLLSFLVTASFMSGKFPPSWQQLKNVKNNFANVINLSRQIMDKKGNSKLLESALRGQNTGPENVTEFNENSEDYNDPALDDVKAVLKQRKSNLALIPDNAGEISFSSSPPPTQINIPVVDPKIEERIRKLEEVAAHLHEQVRRLNEQLIEKQKSSTIRR